MASFGLVWCRLSAIIFLCLTSGEKRETKGGWAMTLHLTTVVYSSRVLFNHSQYSCFIVSVSQPQEEGEVEGWGQAVPDSLTPSSPSTRQDKP